MADLQLSEVYHELRNLVATTLDSVKSRQFSSGAFKRILVLSQCAPMTSGEFQVAVRRSRNALEYCIEGQFGAASYELRILLKSVERLVASQPVFLDEPEIVSVRVPEYTESPVSEAPPFMRA